MNELILMPNGTSGPWGKSRENQIWGQEVKRQGHVRLEIDLEVWRKHYSGRRLVGSTRFSGIN